VIVLPREAPSDWVPAAAESGVSSVIEFHAPQASHWPDHLEWTAPHSVHV
jgi:hypothetical protein